MWTPTTQAQHTREHLRYATDPTDTEWAILESFLPPPRRTSRRRTAMREIIALIFCILRSGCAWRLLPKSFPPWETVYRWFARLRNDGTWEAITRSLVMPDRERVGREASPSAAVLDRQSAKTTEAGGPRGYDAGKKILGRKRRALVDTDGRALKLQVHPANIQDRDGAVALLKASRARFPFIERAFANSAYSGERIAKATRIIVEIVRKPPSQVGFPVHPRRWVVEWFFAWIGRNRRLSRDFERTIASAESFLYAASAMPLLRDLARSS